LKADETGTFGFTLQMGSILIPPNGPQQQSQDQQQQQQIATPLSSTFPIIGYIEPNSSAEKCGILQPGDRIIAINNRSLYGLSVDEARAMIKDCGHQLNMEIEFDVAGRSFIWKYSLTIIFYLNWLNILKLIYRNK
jgi:C-terminal processing protease CtpA/Prc